MILKAAHFFFFLVCFASVVTPGIDFEQNMLPAVVGVTESSVNNDRVISFMINLE